MKLFFVLALLAVLATTVHAWTKEDHEIFDLVSSLEAAEGKGTTFYSWLDVSPTATTPEIARAYRKKSIQLHPDKNPGVKGIHDRFARLGVVSTILRNEEGRKRYDFFYKNGVPRWRGTGYYYSRFRPGLGTVFVFLVTVTSAFHYIVLRLNYARDVARVEFIIREAKAAAWGQKLSPIEGRRKVKVNLGGGARYDDEGNVIPGRMIDMVVEGSGDVFMYESDGSLHPVGAHMATPASVRSTWFIALMTSQFAKVYGRVTGQNTAHAQDEDAETEDGVSATGTDSDLPELEYPEQANGNGNGSSSAAAAASGKGAAVKAGGKRRKAVKRR